MADVAASYDEATGRTAIFVVNRSTTDKLSVDVDMADAKFGRVRAAHAMGGGDVKESNTFEKPHAVKVTKGKAVIKDGRLRVEVPAPGLAVVEAEGAKEVTQSASCTMQIVWGAMRHFATECDTFGILISVY